MKTISELALTVSDITNILPKRIAAVVETYAHPHRYGRQLLRLNTDLVGAKGRSLHVPVRGPAAAGRISEYSAIDSAYQTKVTYSTTEITPFKIGCSIEISQESIDGAEIDVLNGQIEEAGETMADLEDLEIIRELLGTQNTATTQGFTGDNTATTFVLTNKPVVECLSITKAGATQTPVTDYKVDYYAGKVHFITAPASGATIVVTYRYSARTLYRNAQTACQLGVQDIITTRNLIRVQKFAPDVMVVHPDEEGDLLQITTPINFLDASMYGTPEGRLTGEIGKIAGLQVLSTTQMPAGCLLVCQKVKCGWLVMKRNLQVKRDEIPAKDGFALYFYMELAPKVTRDKCAAIAVNMAVDSEKL